MSTEQEEYDEYDQDGCRNKKVECDSDAGQGDQDAKSAIPFMMCPTCRSSVMPCFLCQAQCCDQCDPATLVCDRCSMVICMKCRDQISVNEFARLRSTIVPASRDKQKQGEQDGKMKLCMECVQGARTLDCGHESVSADRYDTSPRCLGCARHICHDCFTASHWHCTACLKNFGTCNHCKSTVKVPERLHCAAAPDQKESKTDGGCNFCSEICRQSRTCSTCHQCRHRIPGRSVAKFCMEELHLCATCHTRDHATCFQCGGQVPSECNPICKFCEERYCSDCLVSNQLDIAVCGSCTMIHFGGNPSRCSYCHQVTLSNDNSAIPVGAPVINLGKSVVKRDKYKIVVERDEYKIVVKRDKTKSGCVICRQPVCRYRPGQLLVPGDPRRKSTSCSICRVAVDASVMCCRHMAIVYECGACKDGFVCSSHRLMCATCDSVVSCSNCDSDLASKTWLRSMCTLQNRGIRCPGGTLVTDRSRKTLVSLFVSGLA